MEYKADNPVKILSKHERQIAREYAFTELQKGALSFTIAHEIMIAYYSSWLVAIDLVRQAERAYKGLKHGDGKSTRADNRT